MTWTKGIMKDMKLLELQENEVAGRRGWRRRIIVDDYTEYSLWFM